MTGLRAVLPIEIKRFFAGDLDERVDVLAADVPCPPFSRAGQALGFNDERDRVPPAIRQINESRPRAVLLQNVRGLLRPRFETYRHEHVTQPLEDEGNVSMGWRLLEARMSVCRSF